MDSPMQLDQYGSDDLLVALLVAAAVVVAPLVSYLLFMDAKGAESSSATPSRRTFVGVAAAAVSSIVSCGFFLGNELLGPEGVCLGFFLALVYLVGLWHLGSSAKRVRAEFAKSGSTSVFEYVAQRAGPEHAKLLKVVVVVVSCGMLVCQVAFLATAASMIVGQSSSTTPVVKQLLTSLLTVVVFALVAIPAMRCGGDVMLRTTKWLAACTFAGLLVMALHYLSHVHLNWTSSRLNQITGIGDSSSGIGDAVLYIFFSLYFLTQFLVRTEFWHYLLSAKDDDHARRGFRIAGIVTSLCVMVATMIGALAKFDDDAPTSNWKYGQRALAYMLSDAKAEWGAQGTALRTGIVFCGLVAAVVGSTYVTLTQALIALRFDATRSRQGAAAGVAGAVEKVGYVRSLSGMATVACTCGTWLAMHGIPTGTIMTALVSLTLVMVPLALDVTSARSAGTPRSMIGILFGIAAHATVIVVQSTHLKQPSAIWTAPPVVALIVYATASFLGRKR